MYNISGSGAIGAKLMDYETAEKTREYYEKMGRDASIEEYDPRRYAKEALKKIIRCDEEQRVGKDAGYTIRNLAQNCLKFIDQLNRNICVDETDEIIELANFHGFDVEYRYPDGEKGTEKAVPISELRTILHEVFMPEDESCMSETDMKLKNALVEIAMLIDRHTAEDSDRGELCRKIGVIIHNSQV